jgi:hypothetical protein
LRFVYTVVVAWPGEAEWQGKNFGSANVERFDPAEFDEPLPGKLPLNERPIVVGFGPEGSSPQSRLTDAGAAARSATDLGSGYPTLLEICGVAAKPDLAFDGVSQAAALRCAIPYVRMEWCFG